MSNARTLLITMTDDIELNTPAAFHKKVVLSYELSA